MQLEMYQHRHGAWHQRSVHKRRHREVQLSSALCTACRPHARYCFTMGWGGLDHDTASNSKNGWMLPLCAACAQKQWMYYKVMLAIGSRI